MTPATRTCRAFAGRLDALSARLERAAALLRTRIETRVQSQNTALLASVELTGSRQLKLQHLVEGLSVVAVSYYALGILAYLIRYPVGGGARSGTGGRASLCCRTGLALPIFQGQPPGSGPDGPPHAKILTAVTPVLDHVNCSVRSHACRRSISLLEI